MRMGWTLDTTVADADTFLRSDNHPDDGATVGTTAGLLTPPIPPVLGQAEGYRFHIWIAGAVAPVALIDAYGDNWLGEFMTPVALTISGVAGAVYSEMHSRRDTDGLYSFSAILPGLLIATQTWVTAQIANIMLSGGGITEAQAQALIDTAVADFQTATEIEAIVTAAIAALPNYQTLAEVNALITTAIDALTLGQTAAEVQALIDAHAAMPNIHHVPTTTAGPVEITGPWRFTYQTPMAAGLVYYANAQPAGTLDEWIFATGSNAEGRGQLTDLEIGDVLRIEESATRYQTVTLTLAPSLTGLNVTILGTADRVGQFEIPDTNAVVTVTALPPLLPGLDQVARDDAATAQSEIDAHEVSTHNTDTTARTAAATVQAGLTAHEATPHGGGVGGSGVAKTGTYAASTGAAANTWVSTGLTPSATATLVGIQFIDATLAAGGLTDVDDWVIAWLDAGRLRGGKTARLNTRPSNQTRVYAIGMVGGVVRFRGNAIGAGEGLSIQVWEQ